MAPKGAKRVVVTGCPMAVPNWKLPALVEGAGAVILQFCTPYQMEAGGYEERLRADGLPSGLPLPHPTRVG